MSGVSVRMGYVYTPKFTDVHMDSLYEFANVNEKKEIVKIKKQLTRMLLASRADDILTRFVVEQIQEMELYKFQTMMFDVVRWVPDTNTLMLTPYPNVEQYQRYKDFIDTYLFQNNSIIYIPHVFPYVSLPIGLLPDELIVFIKLFKILDNIPIGHFKPAIMIERGI